MQVCRFATLRLGLPIPSRCFHLRLSRQFIGHNGILSPKWRLKSRVYKIAENGSRKRTISGTLLKLRCWNFQKQSYYRRTRQVYQKRKQEEKWAE